jgi:hypothetical protein
VKWLDRRSQAIVERAHQRYTTSVLQGSSPCRADGDSIAQSSNYGMASERMELRADQVREVLMSHGVQLIQFVPYRNFGLHVDKLFRDYSGESLRLMVMDAIVRWSSYGCKPEVLKEICRKVFALEVD